MKHLLTVVLAVALAAVACTSNADVIVEESAAATTAPVVPTEEPATPTPLPAPTATAVPATSVPTPAPTATATPEPTAVPVAGVCNAGPLAAPNPDRPRYDVVLDIDPAEGVVTGTLSVEFTPDQAVEELYLRLWPNGPRPTSGGVELRLGETTIAGELAEVETEDPTIAKVLLPEVVDAGSTVLLATTFELFVPTELKSRLSGRSDYMRLGTILPILPWEPDRGWALEPATSLFAESVSSPVADYRVEINVPDGFDVLASGERVGNLWEVEVARDFAISVGRFSQVVTAVAMAPDPVTVTVGVHETIDESADAYLTKIVDSLEQFSSRWGAYPWPSLTFALTPNLAGGIEFPTHIMQGPNTIGRTTSHEVGHMFFYSLVGNNQGVAPWLDEGITSYAEFTYEGTPPGAYAIPPGGVGNATQPMTYWESRADIYYRSVYSQTGFALQQLGSQEDVDCALARYVATNAHQIATAEDFIAAFEPTFPNVVADLAALGVSLG